MKTQQVANEVVLMIKVGCCGFPVSYKKYMREFTVVEVQQSFYRRLGNKQVDNWIREAPEGFEFVLKAPQCVTHPPSSPTYRRSHLGRDEIEQCGFFKLTDVVKKEMGDFISKAERLRTKIVLFQTPASFKPTEENLLNMEKFFDYFGKEFLYAWEPRGREWNVQLVRNVCEELGVIHATDPFLEMLPQTETIYFRMHGDLKSYRYSYSDEELIKLKKMVKNASGYVFFNNSSMLHDAKRFAALMSTDVDSG